MLKIRVIPSLLLKNAGLVKTQQFKNPKYIGDPLNAIRIFNEKQVDELMLLDIGASKVNSDPNYALLEKIAGECFMPLAYGGGIRTLSQAKQLFALGIEKICIQTSAFDDISFVSELADHFGSQSVIVSIDIKKNLIGQYKLYDYKSGKNRSASWQNHLRDLVLAGAGEVLLNNVDKDGTMSGPDLGLIRLASSTVDVPLIALGGVSSLQDIRQCVHAGADAVAAGAFFVFHGPHKAVLITYPGYEALAKALRD